MTVLYFPDVRLRRRADPLPSSAFGTPGLRDYAQYLANDLHSVTASGEDFCDVLAATHIDLNPPWRVIALRTAGAVGGISLLCNPEIRDERDNVIEFETCAAFLCVPVRLAAPRHLTVQYRGIDGKMRETDCDPTGARAVFQGVESLNGRILLDRMPGMEKLKFTARYRRKLDGKVLPASG